MGERGKIIEYQRRDAAAHTSALPANFELSRFRLVDQRGGIAIRFQH
jgi:hypothetical protein